MRSILVSGRAVVPFVVAALSWACGGDGLSTVPDVPLAIASPTARPIGDPLPATPTATSAPLQINYCYAKPRNAAPGDTVALDAKITGGNGAYTSHWRFGDGATDSGRGVTHDYFNPGEFTATLTVSTPSGEVTTCQETVRVTPPGKVCATYSGATPAVVSLSLSAGDLWATSRSGDGGVKATFPGGSGSGTGGGSAWGNAVASPWPITFEFPAPPAGDRYAILVCR